MSDIADDETAEVDLPAQAREGIDQILDVLTRTLGCLAEVDKRNCCLPGDLSESLSTTVAALQRASAELLLLDPDDASDLEAVFDLAARAQAILDTAVPAYVAENEPDGRWPGNRFLQPGMLLTESAAGRILADVVGGPSPEIPPDEVAKWLRELFKVLSDFVNGITNVNGTPERAAAIQALRDLLETLRRYIAAVLGGGAMTLEELAAFLKPFLSRFLTLARPLVGRDVWLRLGQALVRVVTPMAEYLGGAGGAATALFTVLAILAAAGLGYVIGRLIGSVRIGDKTIDDHLADFFYWLVWAPPSACEKIWQAYLEAKERRRQYQNSGTTLDKSVMVPLLTLESALLSQWIAKCGGGSTFEKELAKLEDQLGRLTR